MRVNIMIADSVAEVHAAPAGEEYKAHTILILDPTGIVAVYKSKTLQPCATYASLQDVFLDLAVAL